jgi:hypothetical protein
MLRELIEQEAYNSGVTLVDFAFKSNIKAAYYRTEGCLAVAAVSSAIEDPHEWNVHALHEIKHHESCVYDLPKMPPAVQHKYELLADRLMLKSCMPPDKLIAAYETGCRSFFDFAEYLEITEVFFKTGLCLYAQICGPSVTYKGFCLRFDPFCIEKR